MGDLSAHFSRWEFEDHRTKALPDGYPVRELLEVLERIRATGAKAGQPLRIVSGYRSPSTNRAVGGARHSQHLYGRAADIDPGRCSVDQAFAAGARGVGYDRAGWVVHVDVRQGPPVKFADP